MLAHESPGDDLLENLGIFTGTMGAIPGGNADILKPEIAVLVRGHARLFVGSALGDSFDIRRDEDEGEVIRIRRARTGRAGHAEQLPDAASVGGPELVAVDDPFIAIETGGCLDRLSPEEFHVLDIGATLGFRHGKGGKNSLVRFAEHGGEFCREPPVDVRFHKNGRKRPVGHHKGHSHRRIGAADFFGQGAGDGKSIVGLPQPPAAQIGGKQGLLDAKPLVGHEVVEGGFDKMRVPSSLHHTRDGGA